ncbi:MAG: TlpA family protein disulfide reductase [Pleomorphochaeta sp.]
MDKNKKNSLIIVLIIIVVFVGAYFGYGQLSKNSPDTSYKPTLNTEESELTNNVSTNSVAVQTEVSDDVVETVQTSDDQSISDDADDTNNSDADNTEAEASTVMPDIPLTLLNGEETTFWQLAELGKPVVINLFASWCPPCQQEMPDFIDASEEYKDEVTFIFFDSFDGERETMDAVNAFAQEYFNDDTICVIDPGYISYLFKTNSLPTTILLNRKGEPVNGYQGMVPKDTLINAIEQLLAE